MQLSGQFVLSETGEMRFQPWLELPWLVHGFQTRFAEPLPAGIPLATLKQVHSATVVDAAGRSGVLGEGDALLNGQPGLLLGVRTADCIPLLMVDPVRRVVAAVHAGWRGVVAGVVPRTLEALRAGYGVEVRALQVAVGPCIREAQFEIGPEVSAQFVGLFPERLPYEGKSRLNLVEAVLRQMEGCGLKREQVADCGRCTVSEERTFHSFRRDKEASGRMTAYVGLTR